MESANAATLEPGTSATTRPWRRDLFELSIAYALILSVIWTPRPWQKILYFVAATFIVTAVWSSFPGLQAMGLRKTNSAARSIWLVGVALIAAACAVSLASLMQTLHPPGGPVQFIERYTGYVIFAFVQQGLLQDFFLPRMLRITPGPGSAALAAAAIFSLAHLPNPILTVATFAWGLAACLFFLRYRNLYPLAIAHAILGITLAICIPGPVIRNMRVGLGYLTYSTHQVHHRNH
jgi:membrane protease YdiL (CAAX protease family)